MGCSLLAGSCVKSCLECPWGLGGCGLWDAAWRTGRGSLWAGRRARTLLPSEHQDSRRGTRQAPGGTSACATTLSHAPKQPQGTWNSDSCQCDCQNEDNLQKEGYCKDAVGSCTVRRSEGEGGCAAACCPGGGCSLIGGTRSGIAICVAEWDGPQNPASPHSPLTPTDPQVAKGFDFTDNVYLCSGQSASPAAAPGPSSSNSSDSTDAIQLNTASCGACGSKKGVRELEPRDAARKGHGVDAHEPPGSIARPPAPLTPAHRIPPDRPQAAGFRGPVHHRLQRAQ